MNYDDWKNGEYLVNEECIHCKDVQHEKDIASEFFKALLNQLYGETFNQEKIGRYLEELGNFLHVKIPETELLIERKRGKNG